MCCLGWPRWLGSCFCVAYELEQDNSDVQNAICGTKATIKSRNVQNWRAIATMRNSKNPSPAAFSISTHLCKSRMWGFPIVEPLRHDFIWVRLHPPEGWSDPRARTPRKGAHCIGRHPTGARCCHGPSFSASSPPWRPSGAPMVKCIWYALIRLKR